jgi:hypothetical protein
MIAIAANAFTAVATFAREITTHLGSYSNRDIPLTEQKRYKNRYIPSPPEGRLVVISRRPRAIDSSPNSASTSEGFREHLHRARTPKSMTQSCLSSGD